MTKNNTQNSKPRTKISSEIHNFFSEITGAESEDLIMQVIENDKRLAALKAYAMTA